jgi:hypothetical protein
MKEGVDIYEQHELCPDLAIGHICFRAKKYSSGKFEDLCHEHVPAHRISQDRAVEALQSLVARFSAWPGSFIIHSYLNRRGRNPECYPGFRHHVSYPEPGALRQYVSGTNVSAWFDTITSKSKFRPEQ